MTWMQETPKPKEPVTTEFKKVEGQVIGADLAIASLREGYEALEWCSRQWTICVLREARDKGISREELTLLNKGISDGRKAFIKAWEKFVAVRTGQIPIEEVLSENTVKGAVSENTTEGEEL